MTAGRLGLGLALLVTAAALAGCGQSAKSRTPDVSQLPLVQGATVVTQVRECDKGANAFCAIELVVADRRYKTSDDLLLSEHHQLLSHGWSGAGGDTGNERAADSPGHKLRLTYATATGDLQGVELGQIKRPGKIWIALSHTLFDQVPALSMMLEVGNS
ncbi:MAG: hypothetical protein JOZ98_03985 [Solirubrobacterales bacterium]|nr:hypothetical protein [Solirubrobacterales bacterium]MBV9798157.1 hypothetical protein [Solirubrobacterales bacterium]